MKSRWNVGLTNNSAKWRNRHRAFSRMRMTISVVKQCDCSTARSLPLYSQEGKKFALNFKKNFPPAAICRKRPYSKKIKEEMLQIDEPRDVELLSRLLVKNCYA
jgi:hypothetical protein